MTCFGFFIEKKKVKFIPVSHDPSVVRFLRMSALYFKYSKVELLSVGILVSNAVSSRQVEDHFFP